METVGKRVWLWLQGGNPSGSSAVCKSTEQTAGSPGSRDTGCRLLKREPPPLGALPGSPGVSGTEEAGGADKAAFTSPGICLLVSVTISGCVHT